MHIQPQPLISPPHIHPLLFLQVALLLLGPIVLRGEDCPAGLSPPARATRMWGLRGPAGPASREAQFQLTCRRDSAFGGILYYTLIAVMFISSTVKMLSLFEVFVMALVLSVAVVLTVNFSINRLVSLNFLNVVMILYTSSNTVALVLSVIVVVAIVFLITRYVSAFVTQVERVAGLWGWIDIERGQKLEICPPSIRRQWYQLRWNHARRCPRLNWRRLRQYCKARRVRAHRTRQDSSAGRYTFCGGRPVWPRQVGGGRGPPLPSSVGAQESTGSSSDGGTNSDLHLGEAAAARESHVIMLPWPSFDELATHLAEQRTWSSTRFKVSCEDVKCIVGDPSGITTSYLSGPMLEAMVRESTGAVHDSCWYELSEGVVIASPAVFGHWSRWNSRTDLVQHKFTPFFDRLPAHWKELRFVTDVGNHHWIVLTMCREQGKCKLADSLAGQPTVAKLNCPLEATYSDFQNFVKQSLGVQEDWVLVPESIPSQPNLADCGIFAILHAVGLTPFLHHQDVGCRVRRWLGWQLVMDAAKGSSQLRSYALATLGPLGLVSDSLYSTEVRRAQLEVVVILLCPGRRS